MVPGNKDEARGRPHLHENDPVDGAEGGGVLILHSHAQSLSGLLKIRYAHVTSILK